MYDVNLYNITKDSSGGPLLVEEEYSPLSLKFLEYENSTDEHPSTLGRTIGGVISLALLFGLAAYFVIAV